jgi:zinc transporter, ZIP family
VLEAFAVGALGGSTLVVGAIIALAATIDRRILGLILGFGAGVLLAAVAYELALEAFETAPRSAGPALGFAAGVAVFTLGSLAIDRAGGGGRMDIGGGPGRGITLAIVLGIVLDGVPESAVLGMTLTEGGVSAAVFLAVLLSNLPEGVAATSGLRRDGHRPRAILALWTGIALASGLAAAVGYAALDGASPGVVSFVLAFAGGAILAMLADAMMPEAFEEGGRWAGVVTALGFALGFAVSVAA